MKLLPGTRFKCYGRHEIYTVICVQQGFAYYFSNLWVDGWSCARESDSIEIIEDI